MSEYCEFNKKVINKFVDSITDRVFMMLQEDHNLMPEYLKLISETSVEDVNRSLGMAIKKKLHLENGEIEDLPDSTLIKTYTRHLVGDCKKTSQ